MQPPTRAILPESRIHPAIRERIATSHREIVETVEAAVRNEAVVVVGMAGNPFPRKARGLLDAQGTPYRYLQFGGYLSQWRRRNALKMWTGWPTFPMIFIHGVLIGGAEDLKALIDNGQFDRLLSTGVPPPSDAQPASLE